MVTGDIGLAVNNDKAQMALRNIMPYLDLAEAMGSRLVRVMMKTDSYLGTERRRRGRRARYHPCPLVPHTVDD
jgi:hypothetical protein